MTSFKTTLEMPTPSGGTAPVLPDLAAEEFEIKCDGRNLGLMPMSRSVRFSLLLLRGYMLVMAFLLGYHILDLAGVFGHHR